MIQGSFQSQFLAAIADSAPPKAAADEPVIRVEGQLHRFTALYERVRTLIDYQEERFIRRLAIRRILSRQLLIEQHRTHVGEALVRELIGTAYLENGRYPNTVATDIDALLTKYIAALPVIEAAYTAPEHIRLQRRILGIAAAEVEDHLLPSRVEAVLTERLTEEIASYLNQNVSNSIRLIALRAYLKADAELITWRLVGTPENPLWRQFMEKPEEGVEGILGELARLEVLVNHSDLETKVRRFRYLLPPYRILTDLAQQSGIDHSGASDDPKRLSMTLYSLVDQRLRRVKQTIRRSMLQATVYILITKIGIGLALEIPYDKFVAGHIAYGPLFINILTPPILMILASLGIRPPSQANSELLVKRALAILTGQPLPQLPDVALPARGSRGVSPVFLGLYVGLYVLVFGSIVWFLRSIGFNAMGILIFLFFISVVGFFAYRIRATATALAVTREREGILNSIFDFLALPFLKVGQWLSLTARQLNVVIFVMDFLIEAPFKIVLQVLEDWFAFLREKRDELH